MLVQFYELSGEGSISNGREHSRVGCLFSSMSCPEKVALVMDGNIPVYVLAQFYELSGEVSISNGREHSRVGCLFSSTSYPEKVALVIVLIQITVILLLANLASFTTLHCIWSHRKTLLL